VRSPRAWKGWRRGVEPHTLRRQNGLSPAPPAQLRPYLVLGITELERVRGQFSRPGAGVGLTRQNHDRSKDAVIIRKSGPPKFRVCNAIVINHCSPPAGPSPLASMDRHAGTQTDMPDLHVAEVDNQPSRLPVLMAASGELGLWAGVNKAISRRAQRLVDMGLASANDRLPARALSPAFNATTAASSGVLTGSTGCRCDRGLRLTVSCI
jgi:hypothetical protein